MRFSSSWLRSASVQLGLGLLCFVTLVSCADQTTPGTVSPGEQMLSLFDFGGITKVKDIQKDKKHFSVHVSGTVGTQAPLLGGVRAYELKDETGSIWVITTGTPPTIGSSVLVKGTVRFQDIAIEGQTQNGIYLEQRGTAETRSSPKSSAISSFKS